MMRGLLLGMLVLGMMLGALAEPTPCLYVSPDGNDAWTGSLPEVNGARTDGPLATLHHAQTIARQLLVEDQARGVRVYVRDGTYTLDATLVFTKEDAGLSVRPIQWRAYADERPVIHAPDDLAAVAFRNTAYISFEGFLLTNRNGMGITLINSSHIFIAKNTFNYIFSAVLIHNSNHICITGNDIVDSINHAVIMVSDQEDTNFSNQIINNQIYRCGGEFNPVVDITGNSHRIANNRIFNLSAPGIKINGSGCEITGNEFFDLTSALLIEVDEKVMPVVVKQNSFHHLHGAISIWSNSKVTSPLEISIESNLFYNTHGAALSFSDVAITKSITNNIFINASPVLKNKVNNAQDSTITFQGNIISLYPRDVDKDMLLYALDIDNIQTMNFERNYFDLAPECITVSWRNAKLNFSQFFNYVAWQGLGQDTKSHVIPSPFIAPDLGDFEVRPDALIVLDNKFKPFPTFRFGIYEDEFRASWPPVESDGP